MTCSRGNLVMCLFQQVLVGNRVWMKENHIDVSDAVNDEMTTYEEHGQTVVLVAVNG